MGVKEAKEAFENDFNKTTEERLALIKNVKVPAQNVQVLISDKVAGNIIANQPSVYNNSNLLGLRQRILLSLQNSVKSSDIGANSFFDGIFNTSNLSFLYNPETVFDLVRPLVRQLSISLSDGISGLSSFKSLISGYNTFIQSVPRARLDAVDTPLLNSQATDISAISKRVRTLNSTFKTKGFIDEPERQGTINDIDTLFNNVTGGDNTFPELDNKLTDISEKSVTTCNCLSKILKQKDQTETIVGNFKSDLNLTPFTKTTFSTAESNLDSLKLKIDAVSEKGNKFLGVTVQNEVSQQLQTAKALLTNIPKDVPASVDAAPAKPAYDTLVSGFSSVPTTNIQSAADKIADITKKAQVTAVRDINSSFSTDVTSTITTIDSAVSDMQSLQAALKAYGNPENTDIGDASLDTIIDGGLDNMQEVLTTGAFQDFSAISTNQATSAGKLAAELAKEIELIPNDEGGKRIAFQLARNIMVGIEQTALIAARAIENELPGAVSTLSQLEREVQNALGLIDQFT